MNTSIYQPKFKTGETIEFCKPMSYEIQFIVVSSHLQLTNFTNTSVCEEYDDRDLNHVLYWGFDLKSNSFDWVKEHRCKVYCTNTNRGKKDSETKPYSFKTAIAFL